MGNGAVSGMRLSLLRKDPQDPSAWNLAMGGNGGLFDGNGGSALGAGRRPLLPVQRVRRPDRRQAQPQGL
jgi:hypothetical protein